MSSFMRELPNSRSGNVGHWIRLAFVALAMATLAACGGGGGGGGGDPAPANPPTTPPPPTNAAPVVVAGDDQTIELPNNSVALSGSATDAPASTLTYAWTSEPAAGVAFADAAAAVTTATFTDAGTYVLTLSVSDGALTGTDAVQITVNPPPNGAPVVDAGADQTVELPNSTASLAGTATDDGTALTYSWTAEPATGVAFADAAAAATTATFDTAGTYVLTLTASDGSASGSDTVQVIVNAAVYPAADTNVDDAHGWTIAAPADVGMDAARLLEAQTYAETGGGSGLIVRHGRLVHSWGDIDVRYDLKSTTKSMGGIALGLAIDDGLLTLNDIAQTHLSTIGTSPPTDPAPVVNDPAWLDDITVLQLATHTAGFEKDGGYGALLYQPGTTWHYSDGGLNWLADLLTEVFQQDLDAVLTARVWSVLGVTNNDVRWRTNNFRPDPHPLGIARRELASGISANTNAMARVGLLFLRNGVWADQQVVSQAFVDTARTPRPEFATITNSDPTNFPNAPLDYGVLWWTNTSGMLADVPRDAYWAWGLGDSLIVVIPSLDLVIARTGNNPDDPALPKWRTGWNGDYTILAPFLTPIVQSVAP